MTPSQAIELLYRLKPAFHSQNGQAVTWNSQRKVLDFIAAHVGPGNRSLETGCGYSTVTFIATGSTHCTVTPSEGEAERVSAFCAEHGLSVDNHRFAIGFSQLVLPTLAEDGELDLIYIDGAHRYPYPSIDWAFTERRLKVGGILLVDDVRIPSCRVLHDFLLREANWKLRDYIGDTAIFDKTGQGDYSRDWAVQQFNRTYPDFSFLPLHRRIPAVAGDLAARIRRRLGI